MSYQGKKPETVFKERVKEDLKKLPNCWHVKTQQMALRGTPDILICLRGRFIALELKKSEKDKPDPLQRYNLKAIEKAGGMSFAPCPQNWSITYRTLSELAAGRFED